MKIEKYETVKPAIKKQQSGQYLISNVRGAYPELYEPKPFKNDPKNTPRYGLAVLIPKTATDVVDYLKSEINALAVSALGVKKLADADSCLQDGDAKSNEAYAGHYILQLYSYPNNGASKGRPAVVNGRHEVILETDSDAPYSGGFVNVMFDLYTATKWKKVSGGLKIVQPIKLKPEHMGAVIGATAAVSDMPEYEEDVLEPEEDEDYDV